MARSSLLSVLLLAAGISAASFADDRLDRLPEADRKWLEAEVPYIITESERELFLDLTTQDERRRFVEAFWAKRDPNRATPVNEFKEEHYRRLQYANDFLGRETYRPGWQTDRGRYYIILGEPREVQRFTGFTGLNATELWFYQGDPGRALPSFFYLLFFKRNDFGEFRLYSPVVDGPQALLRNPTGDNVATFEQLDEISPELAHASLSFDTADPPDVATFQPSLATEILMARIEESPKRAIRTDYAAAWRDYGNLVSADYSFNFVPNRSVFAVLVGPEATPVVHFSVELDPQDFTLESNEEQTEIYTTLDVTIDVRDPDERGVLALDKEVFVQVPPGRLAQVRAAPFAYQDSFPLIAGEHTVRVIVRNRVDKRFTVAETRLVAGPFAENRASLGDVVVGTAGRPSAGARPGEMRTFQIGSQAIEPAASGLFALGDRMVILIQPYAAAPDDRVRVELMSSESSEAADSFEIPVGDNDGALLDYLELDDLVGGSYTVRARLLSPAGEVVSERETPILVSPRSEIPRAGFVLRRGFNSQIPGLLALAKGDQLMSLGRIDEAESEYARAVRAGNPDLATAHWKLAAIYIQKQRPSEALELLIPLGERFPQQYEVQASLGYAYFQKEDAARTVEHLERARTLRAPDTQLLNSLAESYRALGNAGKAAELFRSSLELDPEQPLVKERLAALESSSRK